MSSNTELCGLFGKVPQQADFVSRHLPESFIEYWHAWLQAGLSVSREQLGGDWLELYLTSPVWRFAIGVGVCSDSALVGVLIPSVDEIGRYFPLTVGHAGAHRPWPARLSGEEWYRQAEQIALSALDEDVGYTRLIEALEALPSPDFTPLPRYRTIPAAGGANRAWVIESSREAQPNDMALGLLERAHSRLLGGYSLWWTEGSEQVAPCTLLCAGLPEAGQMAAMLDGDWHRWGWGREEIFSTEGAPT